MASAAYRQTFARRLPALLLTAAVSVPPLAGQSAPRGVDAEWVSTGMSEAAFLSINALLGGVTGGGLQALRGGSFGDGFARGSLGGGMVYAGKRLAVESLPGAGFLGRQLAGVGSSVVRNASEGRRSLEEVVLPIGPLRLYVRPSGEELVAPKLDVLDAYWIVYGLVESRVRLDLPESLSAGTPVFRAPELGLRSDGRLVLGVASGGVVFLAAHAGADVVAHEVVHVIQHDFARRAWTGPLDHWLAGHLPWDGFRDRLEFDFVLPALRHGIGRIWDVGTSSPWESEATFLGNKRRDRQTVPPRPPLPGSSLAPPAVGAVPW